MSRAGDPRGQFDVVAARDLALQTMGWTAGAPLSEGSLHTATLAGATVDAVAQYMTDITVGPGVANAHTRLPLVIDAGRKSEAARLCAAINAGVLGGNVWIDAGGVPGVTVCMALSAPERAAAAGIVHAVERSRGLARLVHPSYARIEAGLTVAEALDSHLGCVRFLESLPVATTGTRFAFGGGHLDEAEALARHQELLEAQAEAGLPLCCGPVVFHADGVVECFGCTEPMTRIHGGGLSGSCGPYRELGVGHRCDRCATGFVG